MTAPDAGLGERLTEALCREYHPMHWDMGYGKRNKPCGACRIHAQRLAPLVAEEVAAAEVRARADERERIARCLRAEAHGRNDAAFNRALLFAAGCALAEYDQHEAHSYCRDPQTCPRCRRIAEGVRSDG